MSVAGFVSLDWYLENPTEPESEYIDGRLIQKPMGTKSHSGLQVWLGYLLLTRLGAREPGRVLTELSIQVRAEAILIPDVCVLRPGNRETGVVKTPPLLCIEILSPSDRFSDTAKKCQEYLRWGVSACWILHPDTREAWASEGTVFHPVPSDGTLVAENISLPMAEVFPSAEQ